MTELSYCAELVRKHHRDRFLLALFVPEREREALLALYALGAELAQIRHVVSEPMTGHIRYAWWQEAVDALYIGAPPREQPVLQALAPVIKQGALPRVQMAALIDSYRSHFPGLPPDEEALMESLATSLIRALCPAAEAGWKKAHEIIDKHRARWGQRLNFWLALKLLVAGI